MPGREDEVSCTPDQAYLPAIEKGCVVRLEHLLERLEARRFDAQQEVRGDFEGQFFPQQ